MASSKPAMTASSGSVISAERPGSQSCATSIAPSSTAVPNAAPAMPRPRRVSSHTSEKYQKHFSSSTE